MTTVTSFQPKSPIWVHGVNRQVASSHLPFFHAHVTSVMRGRFSGIPQTGGTRETEKALGFEPSCYWYLWRADDLYGEVVFLCAAHDDGWDVSDGGVCDFD